MGKDSSKNKLSKLHNTGTGIRKAEYSDNLDYYKTPEWVTEEFFDALDKDGVDWKHGDILDPCCGDGAIAKIIQERTVFLCTRSNVISNDLVDRGFGTPGINFLTYEGEYDFIVMNPPFSLLNRFVEIALRLTEKRKGKVALISRLASLETQDRYDLYMLRPPRKIYVSAKRVDFINGENGEEIPSAMAVGWTLWDWNHMDINDVKLGWLSGETKGETRNKTGKTLF